MGARRGRVAASAALAVVVVVVASALAGCGGSSKTSGTAKAAAPFADCAALTTAPAGAVATSSAGTASTGTGSAGAGQPAASGGAGAAAAGPSTAIAGAPAGDKPSDKPLPDLNLPCFTGGQTVNIAQVHGPAIINLWASWCPPCRAELPVFQQYAQHTTGRVHVVGVDSDDDRGSGQSLATDLGVTFPTIFDENAFLLGRVGRTALPVTVFVDARNRITHIYNAEPLTETTLGQLAQQYLGVAA
jgi:thiol-disulfide isomerase/thioredoxin